jgi:hypothetical protein
VEPPLSYGTQPSVAERVRVLDADVLIVDGINLRLANGVAPQPIPHAQCWAEAVAAIYARNETRALVSGAHSIDVRRTGGHDDYNRPFADITLDGADLGDALFRAGLVARKPTGRFDWCAPVSQEKEGAPPVRALFDFGS